ncbi:heme-degrading domain-containing protein [Geodermatophilus sp. SYSU D00697]
MADAFPSLAELAAEAHELQFAGFTNDDAWDLGSALVAAARAQEAPVAIAIERNGHRLFSAALPGATPDNDAWIARKLRVVHRFGHSSLYVRQASIERGTTFEAEFGLDPARFAAHGGAVPVVVRSVGPIGAVAVSGLPQLADHAMVVAAIRAHLGR